MSEFSLSASGIGAALDETAICTLIPFCLLADCAAASGTTQAATVKITRDINSKHFIRFAPFDLFGQNGYGFAPPSDVVASMPPRPMVSTAEEGTMTIEPFSLIAS